MKKKSIFKSMLLSGVISFAMTACSSEEPFDATQPTEPKQTIVETGETAQISISVKSAALNGIVVGGAQTRADDTSDSEINTLDIYLFEPDETGETADANYLFYKKFSFAKANLQTTDGSLNCNITVDASKIGSTMQFAFIANDNTPSVTPIVNSTTLKEFKASTASVVISDNATADVLVSGTTDKSFPMTAVTEVETLAASNSISASLERNVARLDICNYAPNLTITSVTLSNANDKSSLFYAKKGNAKIPSGVNKVSLSPLSSYTTQGYTTLDGSPTEDEIKKANTKTAFYLYEQSVSSNTTSPLITINYTLDNDTENSKTGTLYVYFKNASNTYVSVVRNTRYCITLGSSGKPITTDPNTDATLTVQTDWSENSTSLGMSDNQILSTLHSDKYSEVEVGWYLLADGTFVDPSTSYTYTDETKKPIGVVAYLFDDASRAKLSENTTSALSANNYRATGLVLALNDAFNSKNKKNLKWKYDQAVDNNTYNASYFFWLSAAYNTAGAYDGCALTKYIFDNGGDNLSTTHPAFDAVANFRNTIPAPKNGVTTDWYMPSIGEWMDILGVNGIGSSDNVDDVVKKCDDVSNSSDDSNTADKSAVLSNLTTAFSPAGDVITADENFATLAGSSSQWLWSSTEYVDYLAIYNGGEMFWAYSVFFDTDNSYVLFSKKTKNTEELTGCHTRCVLIF